MPKIPEASFSEFFLLNGDPHTSLVKQVEYYCQTEIKSILALLREAHIDPLVTLDTIKSIHYKIQESINTHLAHCQPNEIPLENSVISAGIEGMVESYKVVSRMVRRHFQYLLNRVIHDHAQGIFNLGAGDKDIRELNDEKVNLVARTQAPSVIDVLTATDLSPADTKMTVSVIPLILHMLAAMT